MLTRRAPALVAVLEVTLYMASPHTNSHIAPAAIAAKVYTNSFFVLINSRRFDRAPSELHSCCCASGTSRVLEIPVLPHRGGLPLEFARMVSDGLEPRFFIG
jgi:hypothetical protein